MQELNSHVSNNHLIPANPGVKKQLMRVNRGDVVTLEGYLVELSRPDGYRWSSSLSRTGAGACELMWAERVAVGG